MPIARGRRRRICVPVSYTHLDVYKRQEYYYGKMGEVTKTVRTLIVPNQAVATYVTQWKLSLIHIWSIIDSSVLLIHLVGSSVSIEVDKGRKTT